MSILLILLALPLTAAAQFAVVPPDARSAAMGGCSPVGDEASRYLLLDYRRNFGLAEMAIRRMAVGWGWGDRGAIETSFSHFGDAAYHEQQMAVEGRYLRLATDDGHYPPQRWLAASVSARLRVDSRLSLSLLAGTRPWDAERPWRMRAGVAWRPVNRLLSVVEVESEETLRLRCGVEYCYRQHFFFRTGFATHPLTLSGGLGVRYKDYVVDLAVETHNRLGLTPQISLALWF